MEQATLSLDELVSREIRAEMGRQRIIQSTLAEAMGVTDNWVSRRLRDETPITVKDLEKFAAALGVSVMDLLQARHEEMDRRGMDRGLDERLGGRGEAFEPKVPRQQREQPSGGKQLEL